jgi:hypothetical protein
MNESLSFVVIVVGGVVGVYVSKVDVVGVHLIVAHNVLAHYMTSKCMLEKLGMKNIATFIWDALMFWYQCFFHDHTLQLQ